MWNIVMSEQLEETIIGLRWNDSISGSSAPVNEFANESSYWKSVAVALFTVMSYEYR